MVKDEGIYMCGKKPWDYGSLCVKKGCPYLFNGEKPFFWLGDTAWLLFHNLTWEEIRLYLRNRAERGFNVIQAVAVHHFPAVNVYGQAAFEEGRHGTGVVTAAPERPGMDAESGGMAAETGGMDAESGGMAAKTGGKKAEKDRTASERRGNVTESRETPAEVSPGEDGYWELVDYTVREAAALGMYVALLPHWGNLASEFTTEGMKRYVEFLAQRYGGEPNIIWVTGGDTRGSDAGDYWREMGRTLKNRCPERLVTFHPFGRTSSVDYFADEPWLDFHMFQSGHRRYDQRVLDSWDDSHAAPQEQGRYYGEDNWRYVRDARGLKVLLPILDAEPSYEHIPQGLHLEKEPYWSAEQIRRYAWWSVLAGACGFTYGHNSVMQFYSGEGEGAFHVKIPWLDALHAPACDAMTHLKRVMCGVLETDWRSAGGAEDLLAGACRWEEGQKEERVLAFHAGPKLLFYTYTGKTVELGGGALRSYAENAAGKNGRVRCRWMNPVSGVESYAGSLELRSGEEIFRFVPPRGDESHRDWLLLLEIE